MQIGDSPVLVETRSGVSVVAYLLFFTGFVLVLTFWLVAAWSRTDDPGTHFPTEYALGTHALLILPIVEILMVRRLRPGGRIPWLINIGAAIGILVILGRALFLPLFAGVLFVLLLLGIQVYALFRLVKKDIRMIVWSRTDRTQAPTVS